MSNPSNELSRLLSALSAADLPPDVRVVPGTPGVASPTRLATEWAGFTVSSSKGNYYAKVLYADMSSLIDVGQSAQASQCAADAGAAPSVILVDVSNGVVLFEAYRHRTGAGHDSMN